MITITKQQFTELINNPNKKIQINENLTIQTNETATQITVNLTINQNTYALNINNIQTITYQYLATQIIIFIDNSFSIYAYDFKTKQNLPNRTYDINAL